METSRVQYLGTGRRKSAIARVWLRPGSGKFEINKRELAEYFPLREQQACVNQPLQGTETVGKFDIYVLAHGGGVSGQSEAVRLGIARALLTFNIELRPALKKDGYLTRDPRKHERKKYGRPGARKRFQFSKR
ncbi:MAG: 30S ribosomal protein S9 [Acidobacteria bacterium]|nr:30S ribosomal protein S9 [Acidobacteriota bacterium]MDA1237038.1 30S ribosomal protein S9 [Acidobacteriota bacterium]